MEMGKKIVSLVALSLILFPRIAFAYCGYYGYRFRTWPFWGFWPFGGMVMGILWMSLLLGFIYLLVRAVGGHRYSLPETHREDPLEILKKRYARGEINQEEYERMKKDLER
jgi:putative membrane protein